MEERRGDINSTQPSNFTHKQISLRSWGYFSQSLAMCCVLLCPQICFIKKRHKSRQGLRTCGQDFTGFSRAEWACGRGVMSGFSHFQTQISRASDYMLRHSYTCSLDVQQKLVWEAGIAFKWMNHAVYRYLKHPVLKESIMSVLHCWYSDFTNSLLTSIIAIIATATLIIFLASSPSPSSSSSSSPSSPSTSSLCPLVPVGVRDVPRRFRGHRLWPSRPLHPRRPLLVRGPLLLHRLHVRLPQGVQDEPLLPHQGTCTHTLMVPKYHTNMSLYLEIMLLFNTVIKWIKAPLIFTVLHLLFISPLGLKLHWNWFSCHNFVSISF